MIAATRSFNSSTLSTRGCCFTAQLAGNKTLRPNQGSSKFAAECSRHSQKAIGRHTTIDQMAERRKSGGRRVYLCAGALRKRVLPLASVKSSQIPSNRNVHNTTSAFVVRDFVL